jgi:hypothetical protein
MLQLTRHCSSSLSSTLLQGRESVMPRNGYATRRFVNDLRYSEKGKKYTREGEVRYFKNKPGFYVLRLPTTCDPSPIKTQRTCHDREKLGFKLGKAERNPTANDTMGASITSGGLLSRLRAYWIEVGRNVHVLHLRVFDTVDLNYYGNRRRAAAYEKSVKDDLRNRNVIPLRGRIWVGVSSQFERNREDNEVPGKRAKKH